MSSSFKRRLMKPLCVHTRQPLGGNSPSPGVVSAHRAAVLRRRQSPWRRRATRWKKSSVTAQFRSEKLQEVPIAITALSADAMNARNMTTLARRRERRAERHHVREHRGIRQDQRGIHSGHRPRRLQPRSRGARSRHLYRRRLFSPPRWGSVFDLFDLDRVEIFTRTAGYFVRQELHRRCRPHDLEKSPTAPARATSMRPWATTAAAIFRAAYDMSLIPDRLVFLLRVSVMSKNRRGFCRSTRVRLRQFRRPAAGSGATVDSRGYTVNTNAPQYLGVSPGDRQRRKRQLHDGHRGRRRRSRGPGRSFRLLISDKMGKQFQRIRRRWTTPKRAPEVAPRCRSNHLAQPDQLQHWVHVADLRALPMISAS